jgi:glutamate-1-semialdehyde 2,1-aminomutase
LETLFQKPPYAELEERCRWFVGQLKSVLSATGPVEIRQFASMFWPFFGDKVKGFPPEMGKENSTRYAEFFKSALDAGIYFPPSPYEVSFLSTAHTKAVLEGVLEKLNRRYGRAKT